jgi:GABA permease
MNNLEHRILVIANQTCPCPDLADEVASRAYGTTADALVVAPALNSLWRHWASDVDAAMARAQERVDRALAQLRNRGVNARGHVGDANPMLAIADALTDYPATEIVIASHPPGQSNWLERGLIERAKARFDVPIVHVVTSHGRRVLALPVTAARLNSDGSRRLRPSAARRARRTTSGGMRATGR